MNKLNFTTLLWLSICSDVRAGLLNQLFGGRDHNLGNVPTGTLPNNQAIPLIGIEVGHMDAIDVEESLVGQGGIRLLDTSHVNGNEGAVAHGVVAGAKRIKENSDFQGPLEVHVVTKIWYTHLGYERTKLAVQEALRDFSVAMEDPDVDLKIHLMLHWPRCYEGVDWMHCEDEENDLPAIVKQIGPPPHLDPQNAWKESWKALEDIYLAKEAFPDVASIGVANFKNGDMEALMKESRIHPHMVQLNVWSLLNDPYTVDLCNQYDSHIQVFDVMSLLQSRAKDTPVASGHLRKVAYELSTQDHGLATAQVVFKWLSQFEISGLQFDPDLSINDIPDLSEKHQLEIGYAIEAILSGNDMEDDVHVKVTFHAQDQDMVLFYYPGPTDEDEMMITYMKKGTSFEESTHPDHTFRLYSAVDPYVYYDHVVDGRYGEHQNVHVNLE